MDRNFVSAPGALQRISSRMTFVHKRVFPVIWFGFLGVFVLVGLCSQGGPRSPGPFLFVVPVLLAAFGFVVMKRLIFDLIDEVWDAGSALVVKAKGYEVRVELSQIINISYSSFTNPPRVTLSLRQSTPLGRELSFIPPTQFLPFVRSPEIEDLIRRVDEARMTVRR
jgi:hypothetical protein